MNDNVKRAVAALAALVALGLGGAAIANATSGNDSDDAAVENGQADDGDAGEAAAEGTTGDDDGTVSAAIDQKARAAAEQATGGVADGDVEPAEPADPVEDPDDQPTPKGAAYEVEVEKGGQDLKVFLDSTLKAIETQRDAG